MTQTSTGNGSKDTAKPKAPPKKKAAAAPKKTKPTAYEIVGADQAIVKRSNDGELKMAVGPVMSDWLKPGETLFFVGSVDDAGARMHKSVTKALDDAQAYAWGQVERLFTNLPAGQAFTTDKLIAAAKILRDKSS